MKTTIAMYALGLALSCFAWWLGHREPKATDQHYRWLDRDECEVAYDELLHSRTARPRVDLLSLCQKQRQEANNRAGEAAAQNAILAGKVEELGAKAEAQRRALERRQKRCWKTGSPNTLLDLSAQLNGKTLEINRTSIGSGHVSTCWMDDHRAVLCFEERGEPYEWER